MKRILLSAALLIFGLQTASAQLTTLSVGDAAPDFTVTDLHGHTHSLADYADKYIVLDLFAYWCGPCQATAPVINEFYVKYGCNAGDVIVLAFEADGTTEQTQNFEDNYGGDANNPTPTMAGLTGGGSEAVDAYAPDAYPTICLIDTEGKIANIDIWPLSNVGHLESAITNAGGSAALVEQACTPLSTPEIQGIKTIVYPNPAADVLNIMSNTNGSVVVTLTDMLGREVYNESTDEKVNMSVDVSKFEAGQYVLGIQSETGLESQMITIQ